MTVDVAQELFRIAVDRQYEGKRALFPPDSAYGRNSVLTIIDGKKISRPPTRDAVATRTLTILGRPYVAPASMHTHVTRANLASLRETAFRGIPLIVTVDDDVDVVAYAQELRVPASQRFNYNTKALKWLSPEGVLIGDLVKRFFTVHLPESELIATDDEAIRGVNTLFNSDLEPAEFDAASAHKKLNEMRALFRSGPNGVKEVVGSLNLRAPRISNLIGRIQKFAGDELPFFSRVSVVLSVSNPLGVRTAAEWIRWSQLDTSIGHSLCVVCVVPNRFAGLIPRYTDTEDLKLFTGNVESEHERRVDAVAWAIFGDPRVAGAGIDNRGRELISSWILSRNMGEEDTQVMVTEALRDVYLAGGGDPARFGLNLIP